MRSGVSTKPGQAQRTDLYGAVTRIMLFFEEPSNSGRAQKYFLIISDGIDDVGQARQSSPILMPLNLNVVTVGVRPTIAQQLFGGQAVLFESISPAIAYIRESSTELKEF